MNSVLVTTTLLERYLCNYSVSVSDPVNTGTTIEAVHPCVYPAVHAGPFKGSELRMTARPTANQTKHKLFHVSVSISAVRQ